MKKYALYFAPQQESFLAQAAITWLGRDTNELNLEQIAVAGVTKQRFFELTRAPYHYGFHGTLKPPFRLHQGLTEVELVEEIQQFCEARKSFFIPALEVSLIGDFLCLRPTTPCEGINQLAHEAVTEFDQFRSPMGATELKEEVEDLPSPRYSAP